mmetsp:Transcript_17548/g.30106  ORF Transcript_17548/g.30106 Transcript_17548/m.30106 type:complete len:297 (+) Transcript_17548:472-1362(+)
MPPRSNLSNYEPPRGCLNKLFIKFICWPLEYVSFYYAVKTVRNLAVDSAGLFLHLFVLMGVPCWLWLVRARVQRLSHAGTTGFMTLILKQWPIVLSGLGLLVCWDQLACWEAGDRAQRQQRKVTAATLEAPRLPKPWTPNHPPPLQPESSSVNIPGNPVLTASPAPTAPAAGGMTPSQPATAPLPMSPFAMGAAPQQASGSMKHANGRTSAGTPEKKVAKKAHSADEAAVRKIIMQLELSVYGNELSEGLLPTSVLPSRVQRLCEEVGVPCGSKDLASPAGMLAVLRLLERDLGPE